MMLLFDKIAEAWRSIVSLWPDKGGRSRNGDDGIDCNDEDDDNSNDPCTASIYRLIHLQLPYDVYDGDTWVIPPHSFMTIKRHGDVLLGFTLLNQPSTTLKITSAFVALDESIFYQNELKPILMGRYSLPLLLFDSPHNLHVHNSSSYVVQITPTFLNFSHKLRFQFIQHCRILQYEDIFYIYNGIFSKGVSRFQNTIMIPDMTFSWKLMVVRKKQWFDTIRQEWLAKTWHPSRVLNWCMCEIGVVVTSKK
jgi:hypothetical protein